ncbi:MAG: FAD-dependent oxidoreductase [Pirellulales bacterium]
MVGRASIGRCHAPQNRVDHCGSPAGPTAAYELLQRTGIRPIVLEASDMLGGISRTVNYRGNRMDIGGHRFFSKSQRVMDWWQQCCRSKISPPETFPLPIKGRPTKLPRH